MSSFEAQLISVISNTKGETEHSLSESGHNKSFCKTAMFSFELDLISAISNPKGATECFLSESGRFGITFGCL